MTAKRKWRIRRLTRHHWQVSMLAFYYSTGDIYVPLRTFTGPDAWRHALTYTGHTQANNYEKAAAA